MKEMFKKILDVLIILIIFIDFSYYMYIRNFVDFRLTYVFYLVYFIVYIKYFINVTFLKYFATNFKYLLIVLFLIIVTSIYNIYVDNDTFFLFIKQLVVICFISFVCFMFVYNNKNNLDYIINLYIQISLIMCCIAIFQEICWFIGFKFGYDLSYLIINNQQISTSGIMLRATSICGEPPVLAYALIFATNIAIFKILIGDCNLVKHKIQAFIIFIGMLLTYSTIGYLSIILSICFILFWNFKKINLKSLFLLISIFVIFFCIGRIVIIHKIGQSLSSVTKNMDINRSVYLNRSSYDLAVHFIRVYYDFQEKANRIKPHRILAINRGEEEKVLTVSLDISPCLQERIIDIYLNYFYDEKMDLNKRTKSFEFLLKNNFIELIEYVFSISLFDIKQRILLLFKVIFGNESYYQKLKNHLNNDEKLINNFYLFISENLF